MRFTSTLECRTQSGPRRSKLRARFIVRNAENFSVFAPSFEGRISA